MKNECILPKWAMVYINMMKEIESKKTDWRVNNDTTTFVVVSLLYFILNLNNYKNSNRVLWNCSIPNKLNIFMLSSDALYLLIYLLTDLIPILQPSIIMSELMVSLFNNSFISVLIHENFKPYPLRAHLFSIWWLITAWYAFYIHQ